MWDFRSWIDAWRWKDRIFLWVRPCGPRIWRCLARTAAHEQGYGYPTISWGCRPACKPGLLQRWYEGSYGLLSQQIQDLAFCPAVTQHVEASFKCFWWKLKLWPWNQRRYVSEAKGPGCWRKDFKAPFKVFFLSSEWLEETYKSELLCGWSPGCYSSLSGMAKIMDFE